MENQYSKKEVKKYVIKGDNLNYDLHNFDAPFRALVIASSGSGKSIFLTNVITLFCKKTGTFDNIYIFFKCKDELYFAIQQTNQKKLLKFTEIQKSYPH